MTSAMIVPFLAGLAVGIVICLIFVSWLLGSMTPGVVGVHTPDEDGDDGETPSMAWLDDADAEWLTQDAMLRWNGSHE